MSNSGHTIFQAYREASDNSETHSKWAMTTRGRRALVQEDAMGKKMGRVNSVGTRQKVWGMICKGCNKLQQQGKATKQLKRLETPTKKGWVAGGARRAGCGVG